MLTTIRIGPLALPTSPLLIIFGFYAGVWVAASIGSRRGITADHLYNAGFYAAIAALVGGRLGHIVLFFSAYLGDPLSVVSPNLAAFQPLAAAGAALALLIAYQRRYRLPILPLFDAAVAGSLGTLAFVALADLLNGRHFGIPTMLPWAVIQWDVYRHPVQLYELVGILLTLSLLWLTLDRFLPGMAALAAIGGYAAVRLLVDAFRDQPATIDAGFRLSQIIALAVLVVVSAGLLSVRWQEGPSPFRGAWRGR